VLDTLGVSTVKVIGHSSGCTVATALAEQRPDAVAGLALIDFGPTLAAKTPEKLLVRLLLTPLVGRLLWRRRTEANIRAPVSPAPWPSPTHDVRRRQAHFIWAISVSLSSMGRKSSWRSNTAP
jgi:pimeloyl-ACP methyl ester carboxylesterase